MSVPAERRGRIGKIRTIVGTERRDRSDIRRGIVVFSPKDVSLAMASTALAAASGSLAGLPVFTDDARDDWCDCPIDPAWILDGSPRARIVTLANGRDDWATTALWDCTPGTFDWHFAWDETVHVLDGVVEVTMPDGVRHRLVRGSVAFFPAGSRAIWRVIEPVRKLAVCRRALPAPLARGLETPERVRGRIARLVRAVRGRLSAPATPAFVTPARLALAIASVAWIGIGLALD